MAAKTSTAPEPLTLDDEALLLVCIDRYAYDLSRACDEDQGVPEGRPGTVGHDLQVQLAALRARVSEFRKLAIDVEEWMTLADRLGHRLVGLDNAERITAVRWRGQGWQQTGPENRVKYESTAARLPGSVEVGEFIRVVAQGERPPGPPPWRGGPAPRDCLCDTPTSDLRCEDCLRPGETVTPGPVGRVESA